METHGFVFLEKGVVFECTSGGRILVREGAVLGNDASIKSRRKVEIGVKTLVGQCATIFDAFYLKPKDRFF